MNDKIPLFVDDTTKTIFYSNYPSKFVHLKDAFWIPCLDKYNFDGHIYVSGATGSGKSYLIKKIIQNDLKKRNVVLFTDLQTTDPSLKGINYEKYQDKDENGKLKNPFESEWMKKREYKKIFIFDDVQFNEDLIKYRDHMLEKGRHSDIVVICVNHKLRDHYNSKRPLNEARFVVTFPCANRGSVYRYLKDEFEIDKKIINELLDIACTEGRHLIIHKHAPNVIATTESILKI